MHSFSHYYRMREDGEKSQFRAILRRMQEELEERRTVPEELSQEVPLNRNDASQEFFRKVEQVTPSGMIVRKLGWKVAEVYRAELDLVYFCFSLLSAESKIPINFFMNALGEDRNALWMEVSVGVRAGSGESEEPIELGIYNFCRERVVPLLRRFVRENLNWREMTRLDYTDEKMIERFRKAVVSVINDMIATLYLTKK